MKSTDVVRKNIFRYLNVPRTDVVWNIFIQMR